MIVVMGYWHLPFTLPFIGAVLSLILPLLFSKKELLSLDKEKIEIKDPDCDS